MKKTIAPEAPNRGAFSTLGDWQKNLKKIGFHAAAIHV
jgi:hypothetical protein